MERERLTRLLEDPTKVAREDLAGLRELTERYPWFSGAHLLRTMGEQALGEVGHGETLRTAAAHLPTRTPLFDAANAASAPRPAMRVVPPDPPPPDDPVAVPPTVEEPAPPAPTPVPEPIAEVAEDPLDAEIRRSAMASSYELLMEHAPGTTVEEPAVPATETPAPPSVPETPAPPAITSLPLPRGTRMRFTAWLETSEQAPAGTPPPPATPPVAKDIPTALPAVTPDEPPLDTAALIDRFIRQSTPEPGPKAEFFTPQQAGKRSLDDTAGLVTETLARIYEKQGNLPKAIDAYRRLAARHPDKSTYFAALSKAIEDQLNK